MRSVLGELAEVSEQEVSESRMGMLAMELEGLYEELTTAGESDLPRGQRGLTANILGVLRGLPESRYYRKAPAGRSVSRPDVGAVRDMISRAKLALSVLALSLGKRESVDPVRLNKLRDIVESRDSKKLLDE